MKAKVRKRKKSPAPHKSERAKIKSTIETLRETHTYGVPTRMFYDRGYQQFIDLANIIQNAKEGAPAPLMAEQVNKRPKIINILYSSIKEIQEITDFSKVCALLRSEKWVCLRIFAHKNNLTFLLRRFE